MTSNDQADHDGPVDLFRLDLSELSAHHHQPTTCTTQFALLVEQHTIPADEDTPPYTWPVSVIVTLTVDTGDQPVTDAVREALAALYAVRVRRGLGVAG